MIERDQLQRAIDMFTEALIGTDPAQPAAQNERNSRGRVVRTRRQVLLDAIDGATTLMRPAAVLDLESDRPNPSSGEDTP